MAKKTPTKAASKQVVARRSLIPETAVAKRAVTSTPEAKNKASQASALAGLEALAKAQSTSNDDPAAVAEQAKPALINLDAEHAAGIKPSEVADDPEVTAIVPKGFRLLLDHGETKIYDAGTCEMPRSHAVHWYSRAQGVKIYQPKK